SAGAPEQFEVRRPADERPYVIHPSHLSRRMPRMSTAAEVVSLSKGLSTPVGALAGVGPKREKSLRALGLATLGDLLEYLPRDYRFESSERGVDELVHEQIQTVRGE